MSPRFEFVAVTQGCMFVQYSLVLFCTHSSFHLSVILTEMLMGMVKTPLWPFLCIFMEMESCSKVKTHLKGLKFYLKSKEDRKVVNLAWTSVHSHYGHELWVVTESMRLRIQVAEMSFLIRVAGLYLRDGMRSSEF